MSEEEYEDLINRRAEAIKDVAKQLNCPVPRKVRELAAATVPLNVYPIKVVKPSKYRAQKVEIDGITFHSKKEGARYQQLKMLEKSGQISNLTLQPSFTLAPAVTINGKKKKPLMYVADFCYLKKGTVTGLIVEDVKGMLTDVYKIKRHLMMSVLGIEIRET
jgi:hypothetical protein